MTPAASLPCQSSKKLFCGMLDQRISARQAHNLKVVSSNLAPATNKPLKSQPDFEGFPFGDGAAWPLGHSWGTAERESQCSFCSLIFLVDSFGGNSEGSRELRAFVQFVGLPLQDQIQALQPSPRIR
jgi:hypothetical protein